jgi:hypothetical protein
MNKNEMKASLLFMLTGLGEYQFYKLPFFKRYTFCASIPHVLSAYIKRGIGFSKGKCSCRNEKLYRSCNYIGFFHQKWVIGRCKNCTAKNKNHSKSEETITTIMGVVK